MSRAFSYEMRRSPSASRSEGSSYSLRSSAARCCTARSDIPSRSSQYCSSDANPRNSHPFIRMNTIAACPSTSSQRRLAQECPPLHLLLDPLFLRLLELRLGRREQRIREPTVARRLVRPVVLVAQRKRPRASRRRHPDDRPGELLRLLDDDAVFR